MQRDVLVVDDDQALLRLIGLILRAESYPVTLYSGPQEAIVFLEAEKPQLLILDLDMPELDGRTFYRLARSLGYSGPVILCSAFGAAAAQQELGAEASLAKPFDPDDLVALVARLVPA